ncbi:MAG: hypothetical protein OHK0046_18630 [Anaerolineae bacterium]
MERTLPRDDRPPAGVSSGQLWFSLAVGTVVWALHLMIVYPLTSLTCRWGWFPFDFAGLSGLQVVQSIATVIAAAITIIAGWLAYRNFQRLDDDQGMKSDRHVFMAQLGLALNILYTALIVVAFVPILTLPQCG